MSTIGLQRANGRTKVEPQLSLPSSCYTDTSIYARELGTIFRHCWQPIGHSVDLKEPGSYLAAKVAEQDVFVVRGDDGVLRGFSNVCRHRGHRLLKGKGLVDRAIVCPYHAWGYALDGRLRGAPNANNVAGFDKNRVRLPSVAATEVGAMVLVNLDTKAPTFDEEFNGVAAELQAFVPRFAELEYFRSTVVTLACNWKVAVENFAECYHCVHAHPTLTTALLDPDSYKVELFHHHQRHSSETAADGITLYDVGSQAGAHTKALRGWQLWPNCALLVNPGSNYVVFHYIPDGPERTIANIDWFFGPWVRGEQREKIVKDHRETTLEEDMRLVAEVQIGLNNSSYERGVLMVDANQPCAGFSEHTVAHLQRIWREVMQVEDTPPITSGQG